MKKRVFCVAVTTAVAGLLWSPHSASAQSVSERLGVHGYMTQAYANATEYPIFGIPTGGTTDYRAAALQLRYAVTGADALVLQFSHRRLGVSAFSAIEDEVEFDWGFYQRRIGGGSVRVGKIPMPRGLFNEVRDVGTLHPFFRASKAFYTEGVETLEGIAASRSFYLPGGWSLDANAWYGSFDVAVQISGAEGTRIQQEVQKNAVGGQLWLQTPIQGVRVGGGGLRSDTEGQDFRLKSHWGSVEAAFDRFYVRGEYMRVKPYIGDVWFRYAQSGVRLTGGLWFNAQYERTTFDIALAPGMTHKFDSVDDRALGLSYQVSYGLVLKAEHHWFEGYELDVPISPMGPPVQNRYFIFSVATAF